MSNAKQKILLIGATGFVGQQVLHLLSQRQDTDVVCYVRESSIDKIKALTEDVRLAIGNIENTKELTHALKDVDGVLYCASLGFPYAKNIVQTIEQSGVKRALFISTTAIFTQLNASSKKVRKASEDKIIKSDLNWTILRPTMIYGRKGDRNMERLVAYIKRYSILPVPGQGKSLMQPIHVDDVAHAVIDAFFSEKTHKKAYNISGEDSLSFVQIIQIASTLLDKKTFIVNIPLKPSLWLLSFYEKVCLFLKCKPRLKAEQLLRLNENKDFTHREASKDFGFAPRTFKAGISSLIQELKK